MYAKAFLSTSKSLCPLLNCIEESLLKAVTITLDWTARTKVGHVEFGEWTPQCLHRLQNL